MQNYIYEKAMTPESRNGGNATLNNNNGVGKSKRKLLILLDVFCLLLVLFPVFMLHKSSIQPYQRGFYCDDDTIRFPFKKSTVPTSVLLVMGLILPITSLACLSWLLNLALSSPTSVGFTARTSPSSTRSKTETP